MSAISVLGFGNLRQRHMFEKFDTLQNQTTTAQPATRKIEGRLCGFCHTHCGNVDDDDCRNKDEQRRRAQRDARRNRPFNRY